MKTAKDPRHLKRIKVMQELFTLEFNPKAKPEIDTTKQVIKNFSKINQMITKAAPAWPLGNINKIDLAILQLATFELIKESKTIPPKVVVDEAVEIAKEYGSESSPSFVNGVLGKLISLQTT